MSRNFFITATGTGVGKTFLTSLLAYQLRQKSVDVRALKPLISGMVDGMEQSDIAMIAQALGYERMSLGVLDSICGFMYDEPLSPDMAARKEKKPYVDLDDLIEFCNQKMRGEVNLIEGVGGVAVPINEQHLVLDWIRKLGMSTILVAGHYLGTLSHTLTAYEMLKQAGVEVRAIVLNQTEPEVEIDMEQQLQSLRPFVSVPLHSLPFVEKNGAGMEEMWQSMPDMTSLVE